MNRKIILPALVLMVLSLVTVTIPAASEKTAAVAVVIEVKSISKLITDMESVTEALHLPSQRDEITGGLEKLLRSPGLAGLDTNNAFHAYVLLPETGPGLQPTLSAGASAKAEPSPGEKPPVVFVFPLSDAGSLYLESLAKSFKRSEKINATYHFIEDTSEKIGDLYVTFAKGKAVAGPILDNVEFIAAQIRKGTPPGLAALPGTVRLGIDVQACLPFIEGCIGKTTAAVKQGPAPAPPGMTVDPAKMLEAQSSAMLTVLRQVKSVTFGLSGHSEAVSIYSRIAPVAETKLAGILKGLNPPSETYMSALPADAFLAAAGSGMNVLDEIAEPYCNLLDKIYGAMGPEMSKMSSLARKSVMDMKGAYSGDYAIGVVPTAEGEGIGLVEMFGANDPAKLRKIMEETCSTYSETYEKLVPGMRMSMSMKEPRTYKGIEILSYTWSYSPGPVTNAPAQMPMPIPSWLRDFTGEMAFMGKDVIYTMGPPAVMNAAIDRLDTKGARVDNSRLFRDLFPQTRAKPVKVYSLALMNLIKAGLAALPNVNTAILAMIPDSAGGLAGYSMIEGDNLLDVTRISLSEIKMIRNAAPMIAGMFAQTMLSGMTGPAPTTPDAMGAACVNNLRMIDAAKEQYALEKRLKDGDTPGPGWMKYLRGGKIPTCPAGGKYTINPIGKDPECSIPGHAVQ